MSDTEVLIDRSSGQIIDEDHINSIHRAIKTEFVGRNNAGAPTAGQDLGTAILPWGTTYTTNLILNGQPIDPGLIAAARNRVVSGAIRATSEFPDYLRPSGVALSFTVLGATTTLIYDVNGVLYEITTDIVKSGLTAAPSSNNTCQINDTSLTGQDNTRFLGENGTTISVDNMQSELTSRIGEFVVLFNSATSEWFYCRIASSTILDNCRRGFFLDSSGNPLAAQVLNNNDTLLIGSAAFIFAEDDGVTIDVTYNNPVISGVEPASPSTGDYWYDLNVLSWKRYNGSIFEQINRTFIGLAAVGATTCSAIRPEYFGKAYSDTNSLEVKLLDTDNAISTKPDFIVSIDGQNKRFDFGFFTWAASSDFESGFSRTASRDYWLYITEDGKPKISGYKPYDLLGFLRGWYHPYESWRAVAQLYNNASNDFELVHASDETLFSLTAPEILSRVILSNNSVTPLFDIDSTRGKIVLDDNTAEYIAPAFTKSINVNWALGTGQGGNPGLTLAANTSYYYFCLTDDVGAKFDYGFDSSSTAANLLAYGAVVSAGFTKVAYQGAVTLDASIQITPFSQSDRWFNWSPRLQIFNLGFFGIPVGPTLRTMAPNLGHKLKVRINIILQANTPIPRYGFLTDPDLTSIAPTALNNNLIIGYTQIKTQELELLTNSTGQIREVWNNTGNAGVYVGLTVGYEDLRLKECI